MVSSPVVRRAASWSFAACTMALLSAGVAGCGSNNSVPERAYVDATLSPTATTPGDSTACMQAVGTPLVQIGSVNGDSYSLVEDQATFAGSAVQVSCSVTPSGSGFAVNATATRSGDTTGGTVHIQGTFTASGEQQNITATFGNGVNGVYTEANCLADYTQSNMGVAAGRVWAVLGCPTLQLEGQSNICAATTEFRFENCGQ